MYLDLNIFYSEEKDCTIYVCNVQCGVGFMVLSSMPTTYSYREVFVKTGFESLVPSKTNFSGKANCVFHNA